MVRTTAGATPYWAQPLDALLSALGTRPGGLTTDEAARRLEEHGPNRLRAHGHDSALALFLRQFKSPIVLLLIAACALSAALSEYVDALILVGIVAASAALSFRQEWRASSAVERLQATVQARTTVMRDGSAVTLPSEGVVPGDVVRLSAGSLIPADGRLLEARDFFVSEAVLTGESLPVEKAPAVVDAAAPLPARTGCVFQGASVRSGTAVMVVVETGRRTLFGAISERLALRPPETEFERGVRRLGALLTEVMLLLVLGVFAFNVYFHRPLVDSLLFSLAVAVGLTPQLLPAIININLSRGAEQMGKAGVIVRRLQSIENFGSMDILCSDKTGTLTSGTVELDAALDADGQPSERVRQCAYWNAHFQTGIPNAIDEAVLRTPAPELGGVEKVDEVPYDFERKRMSVAVRHAGQVELVTKGAFQPVLTRCSEVRRANGKVAIDAALRAELEARFEGWCASGQRVLAVATREAAGQEHFTRDDERELVLEGVLLLSDPPKPDATQAIAELARLGVRLKVVTGDSRHTARAAAERIGLAIEGMLTGAELTTLHEEALWVTAPRTTIFAEVDPAQKERVIRALQRAGHVVGYMGDGINDAPALYAADVGISVDSAVDVAKEAADFVLLQKDLGVLQKGILEGRTTFSNTLKYVLMATSANFGNMFSVAGASLLLPFLPMLPKQVLLINFLTDLPEMMIASDRVDPEMVARPQRWRIPLIRRFMVVFGLISSVFDYLTFGGLLWLSGRSPAPFRTGWFVESVLSAGAVVFALRTRRALFRSRPGRGLLLMSVGVATAVLALPFTALALPMEFVPLHLKVVLYVLAVIAAYVAAAEVAKRVFFAHQRED